MSMINASVQVNISYLRIMLNDRHHTIIWRVYLYLIEGISLIQCNLKID